LLCDRSLRWKKASVRGSSGRADIAFFGDFSTPATDATILNDKRLYLEEQTPSSSRKTVIANLPSGSISGN
jgi:hypothetical protein